MFIEATNLNNESIEAKTTSGQDAVGLTDAQKPISTGEVNLLYGTFLENKQIMAKLDCVESNILCFHSFSFAFC